MKIDARLPHRLALVALAATFVLPLTGCVSSKYRAAPKDTPVPQLLNVAFTPAPLEAALTTLIAYNGPGSWKRNAFWDEYVVTLHNPGSQPLIVSGTGLVDYAGTVRTAGAQPWALEKESKTLERQYKDAGITFVRYTAPAVIIVGAGAAAISSAGVLTAAGSTAAGATIIALPVYYAVILTINHYNKVAMEEEFNRRRLALPLTLAPGETRTGSLFFPMVPNPRSLGLRWSTGTTSGETVLPLDFLRGLHTTPETKS
jgi:hypothetical protein